MDIQVSLDYRKNELEQLPISALARFVLAHEEAPEDAEVSISFVTDEEIAGLNEAYRGIPGPTDVLSFECDQADAGERDWGAPAEADAAYVLGDVVIAPDVARRQAEEFGTGFEDEIGLLLVHGLLHLCGYDHQDDDEALRMEALEREILGSWADRR